MARITSYHLCKKHACNEVACLDNLRYITIVALYIVLRAYSLLLAQNAHCLSNTSNFFLTGYSEVTSFPRIWESRCRNDKEIEETVGVMINFRHASLHATLRRKQPEVNVFYCWSHYWILMHSYELASMIRDYGGLSLHTRLISKIAMSDCDLISLTPLFAMQLPLMNSAIVR